MQSWDLFDTLLTRRTMRPRDVPCPRPDQLFPIVENVLQVKPEDLLISDMAEMTPESVTALAREVAGLPNRVIVTPDGKRTGWIWKTLARQYSLSLHTGDDSIADVDMARHEGIPTRLYSGARFTENEQELLDIGFRRLAFTAREARLRTFNLDHRALELAQIEINFPLLYLAALALKPHLQGRRVLGSARDCWLWQRLLRSVAEADAVYWYSSRLARAFPSESYLAYTTSLMQGPEAILLDLCGTGWSLRRLASELATKPAALWTLAHCGASMNAAYETLRATLGENRWLLASASQGLEHNNLAPHPMLIDVIEGQPQFWNPTGFDWEGSPEIRAQHGAFEAGMRALDNYPEDAKAPEASATRIARFIAQLPELAFFPREDRFVQDELKRRADA